MTVISNLIIFIYGEKCLPATLSARHMGMVAPPPNVKFRTATQCRPRCLSPYCFSFKASFTVFAKA